MSRQATVTATLTCPNVPSKWLAWEPQLPELTRKTLRIRVRSKTGVVLGSIEWYSPWRQYVFRPESADCIFAASCLADIDAMIKALMDDRKK